VADTLSRYPRSVDTLPSSNEMFVVEEDQDEVFPLAFKVISEAQQSDNQLVRVAQANQDYSTKILLCSKAIHYKNKIVIP
jgi:alpha/beta superfamily hydrolase